MKIAYKIMLANLLIAVVITTFSLIVGGGIIHNGSDTAVAFGLVCLCMGLLNFFVGCILALIGKSKWRNGIFLSSAVLLLLSGISCGGGAMF